MATGSSTSQRNSHADSQQIGLGDIHRVGHTDRLWNGQGASQQNPIAGPETHTSQKGASQTIGMASTKTLPGHNASHRQVAIDRHNSSGSSHTRRDDYGVDEDEDELHPVMVLLHSSQSHCVSCIILQHDEDIRKAKAKAKVKGKGKGKSRLDPEEMGNLQSLPNKPSSQDWAISDSEESEPIQSVSDSKESELIQKVKRHVRKMSVILEGNEDDDDNMENALKATDANEDDKDDTNEVDEQCPSSVPNAQEEKHEYLYDLCNYAAYHGFVDALFNTTVSVY